MAQLKIFPQTFEEKVGFDTIRRLLRAKARSSMGRDELEQLQATDDYNEVTERLVRIEELLQILNGRTEFPSLALEDLRPAIESIRPEGTYLTEEQLPHLATMINTIGHLYSFLGYKHPKAQEEIDERTSAIYPALLALLPEGLLLPEISRSIESLLNRFGRIKDNASSELASIRNERTQVERSISREVKRILNHAIEQGWAEEDARPTLRDGHPVIPITPSYKRNIRGIVHDESSTGKTVFVEPIEIVESNNRIRELDAAERKEIIRILIRVTNDIRPHISSLLAMYQLVGLFDSLFAIAHFAQEERAVRPVIRKDPYLDWIEARHPILRRSLESEHRPLIPINLHLQAPDARILIISGPNAGGKSVCLKTCALLQYMLQMGIPIPVHPDSTAGVFSTLAINIGDDQSLEDDLSTYSSHLVNMRHFCALASPQSLLMVDEFGAGTEPELGGAIAEALLDEFNRNKSFGVITTHYRNLKQYASEHQGVVNGAMLYDRGAMRPLFKLSIGQPGSSFALEIAKKSGLPQSVIATAADLVGREVVDTDKYVQDIARDRRYWEKKRENIRKKEKELEETIEHYQRDLSKLREDRQKVIQKAQEEASQLLQKSNAQIERTIREIKESNAERERTLAARRSLKQYAQNTITEEGVNSEKKKDDRIERELRRIENRNKRKAERQKTPKSSSSTLFPAQKPQEPQPIEVGCHVRVAESGIEGRVLILNASTAIIALGNSLQTTVPIKHLERINKGERQNSALTEKKNSNITEHLHEKKVHFKEEIDLRGMRALDALQAVEYFLDDALQVGCHRVRLLHGTGTGALRQSIRQFLGTRPFVQRYYDEDVRFGGAGITIVEL